MVAELASDPLEALEPKRPKSLDDATGPCLHPVHQVGRSTRLKARFEVLGLQAEETPIREQGVVRG